MIFYRYLAFQIFKGAALVLFILVFLSLFFVLIQQLDNLGKGQFGLLELMQYLFLLIPSKLVLFMPLAALLSSILSLGALAGNSELIAFQSSGVSIVKFIHGVAIAAFVLAATSVLLADFVVPLTGTWAKELKTSRMASRISMLSRHGVWIKDEDKLIFTEKLFPDGNAKNIHINQLDEKGRLVSSTVARQAKIQNGGWLLQDVRQSYIGDKISVKTLDRLLYKGKLSDRLLESLVVEPKMMSIIDLHSYIDFLHEHHLNHDAESLIIWQKIYAPISIIVLSVLALPFVLGSQRQSNTGQRILMGLFLGLGFVVINKIFIQMGEQLNVTPVINALIPTMIYLLIASLLIRKRLLNI